MHAAPIYALILYLLYLTREKIGLRKNIGAVPLRIAVTGTRGKSGLVRILTSMFRQTGKRVLGKTTGSEALYLLPDGEEEKVPRRGTVSILEQKKLLKRARREKVDILVAEIMSIQPENHRIEGRRLIQPHLVVITDIGRDHCEAMGADRDDAARVFALTVPDRARVFIPESESRQAFAGSIRRADADLIQAKTGCASAWVEKHPELGKKVFPGQLDLAWTLAQHFGIDEEAAIRGIVCAGEDRGTLKAWKIQSPADGKYACFINAFAANDPESTHRILQRIKTRFSKPIHALLSLRRDRPDRTLQWIEALKNKERQWFDEIFVTGHQAPAFRNKIRNARVISGRHPEKVLSRIIASVGAEPVILGCGNLHGIGAAIIEYCRKQGKPHGL